MCKYQKVITVHTCYGHIRWKMLLQMQILRNITLYTHVHAKNVTFNANTKKAIILHTHYEQIGPKKTYFQCKY